MLGGVGNLSTKADHYSFPAGMVLSERGADGYPRLMADQSRNVAVLEALDNMGVIAREVLKLGAGASYMSKYDSIKPSVETKIAAMIERAEALK